MIYLKLYVCIYDGHLGINSKKRQNNEISKSPNSKWVPIVWIRNKCLGVTGIINGKLQIDRSVLRRKSIKDAASQSVCQ